MQLRGLQILLQQERVVVALSDQQSIAIRVFADHEPGFLLGPCPAADSQSLALAQGVIHQSLMLTDQAPCRCMDFTRLGGQVGLQEFPEMKNLY